jgi:digeranylgeranylglycerophospholipid reductase
MKEFNFIVLGAGTGGCLAARTAAKMGFKVGLIDVKPKQKIGKKVCGEGVGKHHFTTVGVNPPSGDELSREVIGVEVTSPDTKTTFDIQGEGLHGYTIDRFAFGQRLLREALDSGAELLELTRVRSPIVKNDTVIGVEARDEKKGGLIELFGDIIIDSSGYAAILRKSLPKKWWNEDTVLGVDVAICYREIRELDSQIDNPENIKIFLSAAVAPGGYWWIFPKEDNKINVGVGVQMAEGFTNPKTQFYKHVLSNNIFKDSKVIESAGGIVPTRRPLNCMTGNGIILVGDSACQPNPIHGGGIGPSMLAGKMAAEIGAEAIEQGDVSQSSLWRYNVDFMLDYGAKCAGLDVFRLFLQKCSDKDLNFGMEHRIIKEEDILRASMGEDLRLNVSEKVERLMSGIRRMSFLRALRMTANKMRAIKMHYKNYPKVDDLSDWTIKTDQIINDMRELSF